MSRGLTGRMVSPRVEPYTSSVCRYRRGDDPRRVRCRANASGGGNAELGRTAAAPAALFNGAGVCRRGWCADLVNERLAETPGATIGGAYVSDEERERVASRRLEPPQLHCPDRDGEQRQRENDEQRGQ